ncbi:MAG TPA: molybdopterin-dependent oxidoreductase [Alphaproteobacteria bacterium]
MTATEPVAAVRTACPYCGVGCGVLASADGKGGAAVAGDPEHPANRGRLCSKGAALGETLALDGRLLHPEIGGAAVSWDTALTAVADGFARTIAAHGPDSVAFYVSGQLLTEDYYVANKLIKGFLGTANIDTNSRLCMASSVAGHKRAFGTDTVPGNYDDIDAADLVVLVGSNLAWCHPVLFQRLVAARRQRAGLKIVVIDPRRTATAEEADLHLALRPGTDVALFNGLLAHLARAGCRDKGFVEQHTVGEDAALAASGASSNAAATAALCGLDELSVHRFFDWVRRTERTLTVYSQGVNQSSAGTDKVNAIINCHLFTGRIGRPGMGPFSVTGQPNAMGGREVGALANQLAAHMDFGPDDIDRVRRFWQAPAIATRPGLKAVDLFRAVEDGRIKAVWIMATNPAVSLPDADQVRRALAACPLVVVSDCVRDTDTAALAHIRLPALGWGEKDGTVTNSERCISRQRAFLPPPGEARADWWIVGAVARRFGFAHAFSYRSPADIFREHASLSAFENDGRRDFDVGALAGLSDDAYDTLAPTQWPLPAGATEPKRRFFADGRFYTSDGRAKFMAVAPRPPLHAVDAGYPLAFNTGRVRDQWHTMTRTGKVPRLMLHAGEPVIDMHPADAATSGLRHNDLARMDSRWGSAVARVRIVAGQRQGEVFAPMHWSDQFARDARVNAVVNPAVDPVSGQPELKHTPVRVGPAGTAWYAFALTRHRMAAGNDCYWSVAPGTGHWRYEIAGTSTLSVGDVIERFRPPDGAGDRIEFQDAAAGVYRTAWLVQGRIEACVFAAATPDLPSQHWLAGLFTADAVTADERAALLAGRAPSVPLESGPIVCVCFGVSRNAILEAARAGTHTCEKIGATLKAGTNCGSCLPEIRALLPA